MLLIQERVSTSKNSPEIARIDKGHSDKEIFEALLKKHGPELVRPHLLP